MGALIAGTFELDFRRLARAVAVGDGGGAVGGAALDLLDTHLALEGVRQAGIDHAVMQEGRDEAHDGGFLAAMLGRGRGEHRAELAGQLALRPEAAGLVPEIAHLRCDRAETRASANDNGVVFLFGCRRGPGLLPPKVIVHRFFSDSEY